MFDGCAGGTAFPPCAITASVTAFHCLSGTAVKYPQCVDVRTGFKVEPGQLSQYSV
jgi:hypothetical protein